MYSPEILNSLFQGSAVATKQIQDSYMSSCLSHLSRAKAVFKGINILAS